MPRQAPTRSLASPRRGGGSRVTDPPMLDAETVDKRGGSERS